MRDLEMHILAPWTNHENFVGIANAGEKNGNLGYIGRTNLIKK